MINELPITQQDFVHRRKRRLQRTIRAKARRRSMICLTICISFILATALYISYSYYISNNCKDLAFSVEYNFTHGAPSSNKLLRVQKMSLVSSDGENSVVEAYGLAKDSPHKQTTVTGSFKKDDNNIWNLQNSTLSQPSN